MNTQMFSIHKAVPLNLIEILLKKALTTINPDISEIQDNLSDIRSGNLEKLSDQKKICVTE